MSRLSNTRTIGFLTGVVLLVAVLGCSTDSPTAPQQVPAPPPTAGDNDWKITVSINPQQLVAGSEIPATVTARLDSRDEPGNPPPNGTTMSFTTSVGEFGEQGSGVTSAPAIINRGRATILLFAGEVVAGGTVAARLEGSTGSRTFNVVSQDTFITSLQPSTGPASGGTVVTILGVNFREPARVLFGGKLGIVSSISADRIVVTTPPGDLNTEACSVGDPPVTGTRTVDTPVTVALEFADGGSESLGNGFTYLSPDSTCNTD